MTGPPEIQKLSTYLPVSRELAEASAEMSRQILAAMNRTPAEWAQVTRERDARGAQQLAAAQARHAAAHAKVDGKLAEVLDLHGPALPEYALWPVCEGCDSDGHDAEPPEWPCTTWALIADDTR